MSDTALATLRIFLNLDNIGFWSILGELKEMSEARRRNLLRPHDEQGFGSEHSRIAALAGHFCKSLWASCK